MWVILMPSLKRNVQPSQMALRGWQRVFNCDVWGNNTPRCVSFPYAHDTWQLGSLFSIFAPGFYPHPPSQTSNIWTHRISHPPVLLHLKALDSEGREINRGDNLDTGDAFSTRAIKHTWCYYHLCWIIRPLIIVINQSSGSLMHSHETQHHRRSTWAVLTYEKSMCSHDSRQ